MATRRPPTIDPIAADHWARVAPPRSPWLHEEVGRRMEERLEWIRREPRLWADWEPVRGGLAAHAAIARRYPRAVCHAVEPDPQRARLAARALGRPWWRRLGGAPLRLEPVPAGAAQMLWANMQLHMAADPQALIARWHEALAVDGFLMFSCLGPDTLAELRATYATVGWPPASHDFTDMHDWGDMLVGSGFAEPVMDMERITLTFETPERLLRELRELGANLHPARFAALRGRGWHRRLQDELARTLPGPDGRLALTFEIIYGHAFKAAPRVPVGPETAVALDDLRTLLRGDRAGRS